MSETFSSLVDKTDSIQRLDRGSRSTSESDASQDTRGRMGTVPGVRIVGTGSYVPEQIVTNEDLAELGCDSEWIIRRTGIRERRRALDDQATSDLCYEAAIRCMKNAGVEADQIDLIIVATMTPDHQTPSTACHVQRRLGAVAPAMDINSACSGFVYAMTTAAQFVAARNAKCALVIGADLMTRTINPDDKKTYPLFGDGAGAVLLTADNGKPSEKAGILSYQLGSEGCGGEMLCVPSGGTRRALTAETIGDGSRYLAMDGRNVFKWAVRLFRESATDVLNACGIAPTELSLVVLHQANQRIIDSAVADLDVDREKVYVNLDRYGNTSAASIPLALDEAVSEGRIKRGDYVLMCGFGAGLAWGTALLRW